MLDLLAHAAAEGAHGAEGHAEAAAFGISFLTPGFFVALAMLVVIGIMLKAGVPKIVAGLLDQRIAGIRQQLDEAAKLRAEAEKLRDDYAAKANAAEAEIDAIKANAERQAEEIVAKAKADASALIARHKTIAKDKIAAAERAAIEDLRAKTAEAATAAARGLIAKGHDAKVDSKLVDQSIGEI